jgi:hypothetical protein
VGTLSSALYRSDRVGLAVQGNRELRRGRSSCVLSHCEGTRRGEGRVPTDRRRAVGPRVLAVDSTVGQDVSEQIDLIELGDGGIEDQLVDTELLEGLCSGFHLVLAASGPVGDELGHIG